MKRRLIARRLFGFKRSHLPFRGTQEYLDRGYGTLNLGAKDHTSRLYWKRWMK